MTASEVTEILARGRLINVGKEMWKGDGSRSWVQYHRRFPETVPNSVHYEVLPKRGEPNLLDVVIHIEPGTDTSLRSDLIERIRREKRMLDQCENGTISIGRQAKSISVNPPIDCTNLDEDTAIAEVENRLKSLYEYFEPIINDVVGNTSLAHREEVVQKEELVDNVLAPDGNPFPSDSRAMGFPLQKKHLNL